MDDRSQSIHYGGVPPVGPFIYLMGGPGTPSGKFQDATGTLPDRQGWIGVDPFNPSLKIEYRMPRDGQLTIKIYNGGASS